MNKIYLSLLISLSACGGGSSPGNVGFIPVPSPITTPEILFVNKVFLPSTNNPDDFKNAPEHNIYMQENNNSDPAESVKIQARFKGDAILSIGFTKRTGFSKSKEYIDASSQYKNFKYVYLYDELFWEKEGTVMGHNEDKVLEIAHYAKDKGLKTAVTIMPSVILDDKFKLKEINSYDVIGVDIYPSIMVSTDTKGCKYNDNIYTNLLYCSQKKLRDMGFKGQVWYVYQAMGLHGEDVPKVIENLKLQKETIKSSAEFGIEGLVPFGYYLSEAAIEAEPILYQGYGSVLEEYVK